MNVVRVVAVLAELRDVDAVGVLQVAMLCRLAGLPLVGPCNLEMILQGAVFYSLPEAAYAGEELCHLDTHLEILVGVYPGDQSWKDQTKIDNVNICSIVMTIMEGLNEGIEDIYAPDGRLLFLGMRTFSERVLQRKGCFVCGGTESVSQPVNYEHVIPNWLIRHTDISDERLILANGAQVLYGQHKLVICAKCNSSLALAYEDKISIHLKKGYADFREFFENGGYLLTYQWLCLLLIKLLLKDNQLRWDLDRRSGRVHTIGDMYEWHRHHHLLCVARSGPEHVIFDRLSLGSVFVLKAKEVVPFDLSTAPLVNGIRIQVGDVVLIGMLDDAQFVSSQFCDLERPFPVEMDRIQLTEFFVRTVTLSEHLNPRPKLYTDLNSGSPIIRVVRPREVTFLNLDEHAKLVGERMHESLSRSGLLESVPDSIRLFISKGEWTFFPEALG